MNNSQTSPANISTGPNNVVLQNNSSNKVTRKKTNKHNTSDTPRKHCKVRLYDIVLTGLQNPDASSFLKWVNVGKNFQVNWEQFVKFYHLRGGSSARELNIKNRFTRASNGFKKDESVVPDPGYDTVFYHVDWKDEPPLKKQRLSNQPSSPPISHTPSSVLVDPFQVQTTGQTMVLSPLFIPDDQFQPQPTIHHHVVQRFHPQQLVQPSPQLQQEMEFKYLLQDEVAVKLLFFPFNMIKEDDSFNIRDYLKRMDSEPKLNFVMTPSDCNNFTILMASESSSQQNERITLKQFKSFLLRFGPLIKSLAKIRDFVNSGASGWFHGNITREKSEELLKNSFNKEKCTHFLLRSVPIQDGVFLSDTYVFAMSIIMKRGTSNEGIVNHVRIYTDSQGTLKILVSNCQAMFLKDFRTCLDKILKSESDCKPVSCSDFMTMSKYQDEKNAEGYFNMSLSENFN